MAATDIDPLLFHGTLLNRQGDAIKDAKIQLWQADLDGNYLHPNPRASTNPQNPDLAPIVSDFQYFGTDATDSNGNFEFLTYRPGIYTQRPYSHFHFMVWLTEPAVGEDGEAPLPDLITQFYFKDENPPFPEGLALDVTEVDDNVSGYKYGSYVNGTIVVDANSGGTLSFPTSPAQPKGPFYPEINFFSVDNDLTTVDGDLAIQTIDPTVSPTPGPVAVVSTGAPTGAPASAVISTGAPTETPVSAVVSTGAPTEAPASAVVSTGAPTSVIGAPAPAGIITGAPIDSAITSTNSPNLGPAPQVNGDGNGTVQLMSTMPTAQPVQVTLSSSAAVGCNFGGMFEFLFMASLIALRHFM